MKRRAIENTEIIYFEPGSKKRKCILWNPDSEFPPTRVFDSASDAADTARHLMGMGGGTKFYVTQIVLLIKESKPSPPRKVANMTSYGKVPKSEGGCDKRTDKTHCSHWWDGTTTQCCDCGFSNTKKSKPKRSK